MEKEVPVSAAVSVHLFRKDIKTLQDEIVTAWKPLSAAEGQAGLTPRGMKGGESSRAEHFFCPTDLPPLLLSFSVNKIKQSKQIHSKCHQSSWQSRGIAVIETCRGRKLMKTSPRILQSTATTYRQRISSQMCTNTSTPPRQSTQAGDNSESAQTSQWLTAFFWAILSYKYVYFFLKSTFS